MNATPLPDPPSAAAIDLSGDETPPQTFRRIAGGMALMLIAGIAALALFAAYLIGFLIPAIADWVDLIGDGLLYLAAIAAGLAITGFEIMRRGRKARNAAAGPASNVVSALSAVGGVTDKPGDNGFGATIPEPSSGDTPGPIGAETHL